MISPAAFAPARAGAHPGETPGTRPTPRPRLAARLSIPVLAGQALFAVGMAVVSTPLGTLHALVSFVVAVHLTLRAPRRWGPACAAYLACSDVLWRMTGALAPWEFGKYASSLVLLLAFWRLRDRMRWRALPLLYFLALLVSVIALMANPLLSVRQISDMLSFNLSGPLTLATATLLFSQLEFDEEETERVLLGLAGPLMMTGVVTLVRTLTASQVVFTAESSFVTSGGFGPNQVSSVLGLGGLVGLLLLFRNRLSTRELWFGLALALLLLLESALTLSRGGLYTVAFAIAAAMVGLLRDTRTRLRVVGFAVPALILSAAVIVPRLDTFTGGALSARFEDRNSSGRSSIVKEDLRIWRENPVLGVGPGAARALRRTESTVSHTEYSRMLAEHGIPGIVALGALALMAAGVLCRGLHTADAATSVGLLVWSIVSMTHAGMRVAAFGFVFGLAQARLTRSRVARPGR